MGKKSIIKWILVVGFFLAALFFVEDGVAGSGVVEKYNGGYGTFDMKTYDATIVSDTLAKMRPEGVTVYKWYYVFDFIFIVAFGLFQCAVSIALYRWCRIKGIRWMVCVIPVIRGLMDTIENVLLLSTLFSIGNINATMIKYSNLCTQVKLLMIKFWVVEVVVGIVMTIIIKIRHKKVRS